MCCLFRRRRIARVTGSSPGTTSTSESVGYESTPILCVMTHRHWRVRSDLTSNPILISISPHALTPINNSSSFPLISACHLFHEQPAQTVLYTHIQACTHARMRKHTDTYTHPSIHTQAHACTHGVSRSAITSHRLCVEWQVDCHQHVSLPQVHGV